MKRLVFALASVVMAAALAAVGCSNAEENNGQKTGNPTDSPSPTPVNTPHVANPDDYDNSVTIIDGSVYGSPFNWLFFLGKAEAGHPAEIRIINKKPEAEDMFDLSCGADGYTLKTASGTETYSNLLSFTVTPPAGSAYSLAEVCVLSNEADISVEDFFGGTVPDAISIGDTTDKGIVIFTNYKI